VDWRCDIDVMRQWGYTAIKTACTTDQKTMYNCRVECAELLTELQPTNYCNKYYKEKSYYYCNRIKTERLNCKVNQNCPDHFGWVEENCKDMCIEHKPEFGRCSSCTNHIDVNNAPDLQSCLAVCSDDKGCLAVDAPSDDPTYCRLYYENKSRALELETDSSKKQQFLEMFGKNAETTTGPGGGGGARTNDEHQKGPICYTETIRGKSENDREGPENVMRCYNLYKSITMRSSRCKDNLLGKEYRGDVNKTRAGANCRPWADKLKSDGLEGWHPTWSGAAEKGIGYHNYCRNPDNEPGGPWCYTTDTNKRWDYCNVEMCPKKTDGCKNENDTDGRGYRGNKAQTRDFHTCMNWSIKTKMAGGSGIHTGTVNAFENGVEDHNYCRNPDHDVKGAWCYTTTPGLRWQYCKLDTCTD